MDYFIKYTQMYPDKFLGIRYEELKKNPILITKQICSFLDVEFNENMLQPNNWEDDTGGKWGNTKVSSFYDVGDHINPVGRWKKIITDEDLFLCEWLGREQMRKFNIKPEGKEISDKIFSNAIKKLQSSNLIIEAFKNWAKSGTGVQKYPTDPKNPNNWDKNMN